MDAVGDEDWAHFLTLVWSGLVWIARDWSGSALALLHRDKSARQSGGQGEWTKWWWLGGYPHPLSRPSQCHKAWYHWSFL